MRAFDLLFVCFVCLTEFIFGTLPKQYALQP